MDLSGQLEEFESMFTEVSEIPQAESEALFDLPIDVSPLGSNSGGIFSAFKSFFHQVSTWDFTILGYVLIGVLILGFLLLIYFIISGKITLFNTYFGEGYGLRIITGAFGSGKTKNVFQGAYLWKKDNPDGILISNLDYDFVDIHFDSKKDFDFVLKDLVQYIRDTNKVEDLKKSIEFPPIKIIVDEAHLYLFARDFKGFTKDILLVLTQCRKRDIAIDFITQELGQIDVFIRRLAPYIEYFDKKILGLTKQSMLYSLDAECTSMRNEEAFEELESSYLLPFSWGPIFNKSLKGYYDQKFLTKYVIGGVDVYYSGEDDKAVVSNRYGEFKAKLDQSIKNIRTPKVYKNPVGDLWYSLTHKDEVNEDIIKKQKEVIQRFISMIPEELLTEEDKKLLNNNNSNEVDGGNVVEKLEDSTN